MPHDQQGTGFQSENKKREQPNTFETSRQIALLTKTEQNNSLRQKANQQSTDVNVESLKRRSP